MKYEMTATISKADYDWIMDFVNSDEPDFDAAYNFAELILNSSFKEIKE